MKGVLVAQFGGNASRICGVDPDLRIAELAPILPSGIGHDRKPRANLPKGAEHQLLRDGEVKIDAAADDAAFDENRIFDPAETREMRNVAEIERDGRQVLHSEPGVRGGFDKHSDVAADAHGPVLDTHLAVGRGGKHIANRNLFLQVTDHHVEAGPDGEPAIEPIGDRGKDAVAEDGGALQIVPADPVQIVFEGASEIGAVADAYLEILRDASDIEDAGARKRDERVSSVRTGGGGAIVGSEDLPPVDRLDAYQQLRAGDPRHSGRVGKDGGSILGARSVTGGSKAHVGSSDFGEKESAGV